MPDQTGPTPTGDGRWIVVDGRRWRASDPAVPDGLRQELVDELMAARRAVGVATRAGDDDATATARRRVQAAKVALGERGHPWWEPATDADHRERLRATVLALARHRAPDRTICPSDAARAAGGERWRTLMDLTREVVADLAIAGEVEITQRGAAVDPTTAWKGPIRVRATGVGGGCGG